MARIRITMIITHELEVKTGRGHQRAGDTLQDIATEEAALFCIEQSYVLKQDYILEAYGEVIDADGWHKHLRVVKQEDIA